MTQNRYGYDYYINHAGERLSNKIFCLLPVVLISWLLVFTFLSFVPRSLNLTIGNLTPLPSSRDTSKAANWRAVWISIGKQSESLNVIVDNSRLIAVRDLPKDIANVEFRLKEIIDARVTSAFILSAITKEELEVIFSVDPSVVYGEFKHFVYMLARLGVSEYSIETRREEVR